MQIDSLIWYPEKPNAYIWPILKLFLVLPMIVVAALLHFHIGIGLGVWIVLSTLPICFYLSEDPSTIQNLGFAVIELVFEVVVVIVSHSLRTV